MQFQDFIDINSNTGTNTVEAYDPQTDTWTTKAPIPTPRAFFSTSVVNGIIYAFGGFNSIGTPSLGNVEAYDPVEDEWTIKNDMPNPRAGMTTCTVDGNNLWLWWCGLWRWTLLFNYY